MAIDQSASRSELAAVWQQRARLTRADIFGNDNLLMPIVELVDAVTAAPGFVGERYRRGGMAILSINPAGGKKGYVATEADRQMYATFRALRDASPEGRLAAFEQASAAMIAEMPKWRRLYGRHVGKILDALGLELADIAYLHLVPFRTRGDRGYELNRKPNVLANGYERGLRAQLMALAPGRIIAIDKLSDEVARRYAATVSPQPDCRYWPREFVAHAERARMFQQLKQLATGATPPQA